MRNGPSRDNGSGRAIRACPIHGHAHGRRQAMSRRRFLRAGGLAAGALALGPSAWAAKPKKPHESTPVPIPGGFSYPLRDGSFEFFHNLAPGVFDPLDADRSGIFNFKGDIGYAIVDGAGVGRDLNTGHKTPLEYEVDLRFMQGEYVGEDGRHRHGTFCVI